MIQYSAATQVLASWYRESDEFSTLMNYRILRAGHIRAGNEFRVQRQSVAGHELIFCLQGVGHIRLENKIFSVQKGQLAWLPVRWPHEHYADQNCPWELLWIRMDGSKINHIIQILDIFQNPIFQFSSPDKIVEIYHHIFSLMGSQTLIADAHCDLLCAQLVFTLLEHRSLEVSSPHIITHRGLGKLIYQIHSHYNDDWDIEKFMCYCQVSRSQLFRLFHVTFGQSPLQWLRNYRMSQAKRLLVETDERVSVIAAQIGYNDPLHFSRDFHHVSGVSPREFRRRERVM